MTSTQSIIRQLTEQLLDREAGLTLESDPDNFQIARDYALKQFKTHKFGRTNQFDIQSRLEGLDEKFRINNRENLAEALTSRLEQIPNRSTFPNPEILHLLLELSDEPLIKTDLSSLDALVPSPKPKELTWEDIIAEDPLEGEIWRDVDFGVESSEGEGWSSDDDNESRVAGRSRLWEMDDAKRDKKNLKRRRDEDEEEELWRTKAWEGMARVADEDGLRELKARQYWQQRVKDQDDEAEQTDAEDAEGVDVSLSAGGLDNISLLSEVQALREIIFMLLGHPCALFRLGLDADDELVWIDVDAPKKFAVRSMSQRGFESLLEWFAERGTSLNRIRALGKCDEQLPERQAFIAACETKLSELGQELTDIEEGFVGAGSAETVSLLSLQSRLDAYLRPFLILSTIAQELTASNPSHSAHIEKLYQETCELQAIGDAPSYKFMATIFFACLRTYLRPIRRWMECGALPPSRDFLVELTGALDSVPLGEIWQGQFHLRRLPGGQIDAPSFLRPFANRAFTAGKSVVFLKHLLPSSTADFDEVVFDESTELSFDVICHAGTELAPFSSLFSAAFSRWLAARHHSASSRLRTLLFTHCGLWRSLDALDLLFFGKNGYLFETLATGIFSKLDRQSTNWSDRFLLTELIQAVFANTKEIDISRVRMFVNPNHGEAPGALTSRHAAKRQLKKLRKSMQLFEVIEVDYRLPWPLQNIIRPSSLALHRSVFSLLLQLLRCQYLLNRLHLLLLQHGDRKSRGHHMSLPLALKQRFLWFTNTLFSYLTDLAIRPVAEQMRRDMESAKDVDEMCAVHENFVKAVEERCLLGDRMKPFQAAIQRVLEIVGRFAEGEVERAEETGLGGGRRSPGSRSRSRSRMRRRRRRGEEVEDEDSESDGDVTIASSAPSEGGDGEEEDEESDDGLDGEERYRKVMVGMREEFGSLVGFVKDGVRGVARAGVMPHLEMLAEALEGGGAWGER